MPESNLENLIIALKSEAIEAAEKEASELISKARVKAGEIVAEAEGKRDEMIQNAEKQSQAILDKGDSALQQAARDVRISLRNDLLAILRNVLENEVQDAFSPDLVEKAVLSIVENAGSGVSLNLSGELGTQLSDQMLQRLKTSQNLDAINRDNTLSNGFSITNTEEGWSYDITPGAVTELLYAHLSPKWMQILKKASEP